MKALKKHEINHFKRILGTITLKSVLKFITICVLVFSMIVFFISEIILYNNLVSSHIFIIQSIFMMYYIYIGDRYLVKNFKAEIQDMKIKNLENMYDGVRGLNHNFSNFVQALDGYVQTNNMDGIKQMSKGLLDECSNLKSLAVLDRVCIKDPAIYSLISKKFYRAEENGVNMNIEILTNLTVKNVKVYELCKILGILLDNAIEASVECERKIVNVRIMQDTKVKRTLIIIENTYKDININLDEIFEKGYSTKSKSKQNHGLGLWHIRKILSRSCKLNLYTTKDTLFRQQLEIY